MDRFHEAHDNPRAVDIVKPSFYKSTTLRGLWQNPRMESRSVTHPEAVGARLRAAREAFGLSQKQFAERAGATPTAYNNWEKGIQRPSIDRARGFCEAFGLTLDFIFLGRVDALPHNLAVALASRPLESASSKSSASPD